MSHQVNQSIESSIVLDRGELVLEPIFRKGVPKQNEDSLDNVKRNIQKFKDELNSKARTEDNLRLRPTMKELFEDEGILDGEDDSKIIEDARITKFYFRKMQMVEGGAFIFALVSMLVSVIEYDMRFNGYSSAYINTLLIIISLSTIILVILTYIRYNIEIQLMKAQNILSKRDDIISSGRIYTFLFELLIILPHPNIALRDIEIPSMDLYDQLRVVYQLNDFLDIYILMRTFILFRVLLNTTDYASTRATRICRMYGCDPGYFYATKCLMSETPLKTVTILFLVSILIGGQAIRICEEPLTRLTPEDAKDFSIYLNCFWCMIITMTTVGYGDYYARTIPGRFITVIACIVGVFLVSIMVVALTNTLNMNSAEAKAHNVINRLAARGELQEQAANLLTSTVKFSLDNRKAMIQKKDVKKRLLNIKGHAENFKNANRLQQLKQMFDGANLSEEMTRHFDYLKDDLREIYENQVMLRDYLLKLKKHTQKDNNMDDGGKFHSRI